MLSESKDTTDSPHDGGTAHRRRTTSAAAQPSTAAHDPAAATSASTTSRKRHRTTAGDHDRTDDTGDRTGHTGVRVKRHRAATVDPALFTRTASGDPHAAYAAHGPAHGTSQRLDPTAEHATPSAPPCAAAVPLPSPDAPTPVLVAELESWTARVRNEPNPFIAVISARLCAGSIAKYILNREQVAPHPAAAAAPAHPVLASTEAAAAQLATVAARSIDLARAHAAMVQLLDSMRARIRSDQAFETLCNDAVRLAVAAPAGTAMGSVPPSGPRGGVPDTGDRRTASAGGGRRYSPTMNRPTLGRPCSPGALHSTMQFSFNLAPPPHFAASPLPTSTTRHLAPPSAPSAPTTTSNDDLAHIQVTRMLDAACRARDAVANWSAAMVHVDDAVHAAHDFLVTMGADEAAVAATVAGTTRTPLDRLAKQVDRLRWFHRAVAGCEDVADAAAGVARVIEVLDALGRDFQAAGRELQSRVE
ncbi:hypothetical protein AMAG_08365 [Allomyces macrogynus ATCC 38327]|uniref:Uncharacterized protein n=1 Tax=Allomyces macrogynus (strain ATCC 38327) TaxID=578462 RepID=A0A0L0SL21_ALLM3|nr:hypothetical protein AMAG_08365 [Allomyces macrogynus ATCC 38327]|eukprot:KNE63217.1 hypothetical protein AMAG_08365 [Allomyces macrogynus ATCC 38327]